MPTSKPHLRSDSPQFLAMCEAVLGTGAAVRFHARGLSMQPNINDGECVELRPAAISEVSKGEIVLAQTGDGLRLHRVVERKISGVLTRGDAGKENDAPTISIVGKAVAIENANGRESLQGAAVGLRHSICSLFRRVKLAAARRISNVRGSLFLFLIFLISASAMVFTPAASAQADLAVTSDTAAPNPVSPGGQITYTIVVANNGPSAATTPSVTMNTPANTTFVSAAKTGGNGTWNCVNPNVGGTGTITCTRATNLTSGNTNTFTFVVLVNTNIAGNTVIANSVNISSSTADPTPANNTATTNVTVNAADLGLTQSANPTVAQPGGAITYTLTLTNNGANAAAGAVVYQQTPPNTTFQSVAVSPAAGWTCTAPAVGGTGQILCSDSANLNSAATVTFTIVVNVNAGTPSGTVILNSADTTATTADPDPTNNASTSSVLVENGAEADLSVSMSATPTPVFIASNLTYTIQVQNLGLVNTANGQLVDTIPAGTTFVSSTTSQGSCSGAATVTCTFGAIASGSTITVTIAVTTPTSAGTLTNTATVSSTTADPVSSNNSATVATVVQPLVCASPGRDGSGGTLTGIVNAYYPPKNTGTLAAGSTSVALGGAAAGGAQTAIAAGDLLLVIQMQDAAINSTNTSSYGHGTPGEPASGWTVLNNSGNFEYVTATNGVAVGGGTLNFKGTGPTGGLLNTYTSAAYNAGVQGQRTYQVIRVPQYTSATFSSGLTAMIWNGATGGVLVLDVASQLTLGGTVAVDGLGFRGGGGRILGGGAGAATDYVTLATNAANGSKGEGIAGTPRFVAPAISAITTATAAIDTGVEGLPNGSYARGAPGNAGAGATDADPVANDQNSGGGGGGNGGSGGQGGFGWNSAGIVGGFGGMSFPGTSSTMVLGGSGGAGTTNNGSFWDHPSSTGNNNCGTTCTGIFSSGAAGGGIVIVHVGSLTGTGTITANGANALDVENDGGGGGGAGGSIRVLANSGGIAGLTVLANGGSGGNTWPAQVPAAFPGNRHGPGGGGGGGALFLSGSPTSFSVLGGSPGATTTALDPYGATTGAAGTLNTSYTIPQTPGTQPGSYCSSADLAVTNSGSPSVVVPGNNITYTQVVTNNGPMAAVNALFTEAIPTNTTFQSLSVPAGWACTTPAVGATGNINCTNPLVANAAAGTFTLAVQVNAGTTNQTQITDVASVTSGTSDPLLTNNSASVTTIVGTATGADLRVTNSATPNPVVAGQNITYTQVVSNAGPAAATNLTFTEALPANTTFVSMSTPAGWSCSTPAVGVSGTITCTISALAVGGSATFQPVLKVTAGTAAGTVISDSVSINSTTPDPNPTSNDATANVTVATATQADLAVTASASPNPVLDGNNITFTETVTNNGPVAAATDTFTTSVPANTTFVSLGVPVGWACITPAVGTAGPVSITCTVATMAANTTVNFPLVVKVVSTTAPGTIISISPSVASITGDPTSSNNTTTASTVVASPTQADVAIVKTASPEPVDQNTNLVYTLQITNNGPAVAQGVTVSDPIPSQVTFTSVSTTQGNCSLAGTTVNCTIGSMPVGSLVIVTINASANTFSSATTSSNTATVSSTSSDPNAANNTSTAITTIQSPTAVQLVYFHATPQAVGGAILEWKTRDEVRNLGFNAFREDATGRHRLNPSIIAGSALVLRHGHPQHAAKTYRWIDTLAFSPDVSYWIEDVDLNGTRTVHGPAQIEAESQATASATAAPLLAHLNRAASAMIASKVPSSPLPHFARPILVNDPSIRRVALDGEPAVKISVENEGWYNVTQQQLIAAGFDARANARSLQLFAEGVEQPLLILGNQSGPLGPSDAIEFYGTGIDTPFSGARVYWLTWSGQPGKRITLDAASNGGGEATSFPATVVREDRTTYFAVLLNGEDKDNFFGAIVTSEPVDQELIVAHSVRDAAPITLDVTLQGVTDAQQHTVAVTFNGASLGAIDFANLENHTTTFSLDPNLLEDGSNIVNLNALNGDNDVSLVQSIALHYSHSFGADADWLRMQANSGSRVQLTNFTSSQIRVFDVTNPLAVQQVPGTVQLQGSTYGFGFTVPGSLAGGQSHTLVAVGASQISSPSALSRHAPNHLEERADGAGIVVITHPDFAASLAPLVQLRQRQGYSVKVVTTDELFDAFHYGERSPFALRNFLQVASTEWRVKPQAVLLVGDASLDPRNYLGFGDFDFVPTRLIETSELKTASDDWLTDFNSTGFSTIPTGRLPVRTSAEADAVVAKIVEYESGYGAGAWNSQALTIADQTIGADFTSTTNAVANSLSKSLRVTKILADQSDPQTTKQQIIDAINNGQVLVNYSGHGSVEQWSFSDLLDNSDVATLSNGNRLPVFLIMNCLNGFFQDVFTQSLAESLILAPKGGAVAVWASSGFTEAPPQASMDQALVQLLQSNPKMPLGRAILLAKSQTTNRDVRRTWILFGDPAMHVHFVPTAPIGTPRLPVCSGRQVLSPHGACEKSQQ